MTQEILMLLPGELYFGDHRARLKTLLGSCVAIAVWHPQKHVGGMCHAVLPSRPHRAALDARYVDEAMQLFADAMAARHTRPQEYQAWLFGGANMFAAHNTHCAQLGNSDRHACAGCRNVGCRNRLEAQALMKEYGITLLEADVGGNQHREIDFQLGKGRPAVRKNRTPTLHPPQR